MHLLSLDASGELGLTTFTQDIPPYAILSHTWGADDEEVTFRDLRKKSGKDKIGYEKIRFCGQQATNLTELSEAITSMFRWYRNAEKCYVYLSDVSSGNNEDGREMRRWKPAFRKSRWFTRAWTLQELIAPKSVGFFSCEGDYLGSKETLELQVHELTDISLAALRGAHLSEFSVHERFRWAEKRSAKRIEDRAYSLLGIFDVSMSLRYGEGDNAFKRLEKKTGLSSQDLHQISYPVHWNVPLTANTLFTGREEILEELESIVHDAIENPLPEEPCWIVVSGMGGQGKSELSLQLAHRVRQLFWGIFWVDVSTPTRAESGFLEIGERLQPPTQKLKSVRQGLANLKEPWLLVLDNADDVDVDYQRYFPSGLSGVVLLTSRNAECQHYATAKWIHLEGLPDPNARSLLFNAAHVPEHKYQNLENDAQAVVSLLRSHPLALIQAGSYVARGHCVLGDYPRVYERHRKRLLKFRPSQAQSRYGDVYATLEASAELLQSSDTEAANDALQLLSLLSILGNSPIPLQVFEEAWKQSRDITQKSDNTEANNDLRHLTSWHIPRLPQFSAPETSQWDSFQLIEAVNLLKTYSLISTEVSDKSELSVSMHPLVYVWANERLSPTQLHQSWIASGCLIALFSPNLVFWQKHQRQFHAHIHALLSRERSQLFSREPPAMIVRIFMSCAWQLYKMRDDERLLDLLDGILQDLNLDNMIVETQWLGIYELRGRGLIYHGRVKEAVVLMKQVVKAKEKTMAEADYSRLASQHVLSKVYQADGQIQKAIALMEHVAKVNEKILAEDDRSRLASQCGLAQVYQLDGQLQKAVTLMEHVVAINERILAEDHHSRLASQHILVSAYLGNGQSQKAVTLMEHVVKINKQNLAEDHPHVMSSQHQLAMAYRADGRVKEAVSLLEYVVKIRGQFLPESHPDLLTSQKELSALKSQRSGLL
ncbi:hypothetical protein FSARC_11989 [Fusarium sarcochroum]|uniref:NB-ARC domain-containing protein n=1 Tax=Fusarium sarcochroum TaxID=1208366 RepID=A0A8H4TBM3_9HYPO|nr:hypothetical protein FSARC_11989 [Fusarium sarcochroum]